MAPKKGQYSDGTNIVMWSGAEKKSFFLHGKKFRLECICQNPQTHLIANQVQLSYGSMMKPFFMPMTNNERHGITRMSWQSHMQKVMVPR